MSRLQLIPLDPQNRAFLREVRRRHPHRTSICGALLSEVSSSHACLENRWAAARLHRYLLCKRGTSILGGLAWNLNCTIETGLSETNDFPTGPKRHLLDAVLFAIARIDSPSSHALLEEYLLKFENLHLRSDVLEAMAFEGVTFNAAVVAAFLTRETPEPMLLSALYAMRLQLDPYPDPSLLREMIAPLVRHPSADVRAYTVRALWQSRENLDLISSLASDPDPEVRESVADVINGFEP